MVAVGWVSCWVVSMCDLISLHGVVVVVLVIVDVDVIHMQYIVDLWTNVFRCDCFVGCVLDWLMCLLRI